MAKDLKARIENDFTYHRPPAEKAADFVTLREKAKELANLFLDLVPSGREQASALTSLEVAVFHANAGIARQYPAEVLTAGVPDPLAAAPAPKAEDKESLQQGSDDSADPVAKEPEVAGDPVEGTDQPPAPQHPGRIVA